ncbi:hypothetical protein [Luteimonas aquatica]|uniref:hypothetical protein n=1 Tax=Luteimonas aquatica TaxID=450364 RepID=UPI001F55C171|nr:hypothetical protein [Luteimonas aquatica]
MSEDWRTLSPQALQDRLRALQARAFQRYEAAAARAEAEPARADAEYAQAERDVAPWIAEARAVNEEFVRRLRRRARGYRLAALAAALLGACAIAWWMARG